MIENLTIDCDSIFVSRSRGLSFESYPPNADIYLILSGGIPAYTGMKTPDIMRNLPLGDYDYILKKEGYYDYIDTITVNLGNTNVTASLAPIPSTTSNLVVAAMTVPILGLMLAAPAGSVIPITTGKLGGNIVAVKAIKSK